MRRTSGFGIAQILIASALVGGLALVASKVLVGTNQGQKNIELKGGLEDIRILLRRGVDCQQSLPAACTAGVYVPLLTATGATLVAANGDAGESFSGMLLRTSCAMGPGSLPYLLVEAKYPTPRDLKDPVLSSYNTAFTSLFRGTSGPGLCVGGGSAGDQVCEDNNVMVGISSVGSPICTPTLAHNCAPGSFVKSIQGSLVVCEAPGAPSASPLPPPPTPPVLPTLVSKVCTLHYKGYGKPDASCTPPACDAGYTSKQVVTKTTGTGQGVLGNQQEQETYNWNGSAMCVVNQSVCTGKYSGKSKDPATQNTGVKCECTRTCELTP